MKKITIIIPFRNEKELVTDALDNIYQVADKNLFDIILVDDCSTEKTEGLDNYPEVTLIRNGERLGAGESITRAAYIARTPYLFMVGADVRFRKNKWLEYMIEMIESDPEALFCGTVLGMNHKRLNISTENEQEVFKDYKNRVAKSRGKDFALLNEANKICSINIEYKEDNKEWIKHLNEEFSRVIITKFGGATMLLYIHKGNAPKKPDNFRNIIEAKWMKRNEGIYEIPCVLGAAYGVSTDWFKHLRGWEGHKYWGTAEPMLSLKSWLAGGSCKMASHIETGHIFGRKSVNNVPYSILLYNKMFIAKTILPKISDDLIGFLGTNLYIEKAKKLIEENIDFINEMKDYNKSISEECYRRLFNKFTIDYKVPVI